MSYRIGVDARLLSEQVTGIGRYTYEMLSRMVERGHEWFLYSHMPLIVGEWNQTNVHARTSRLPGRIPRMVWAQTVMPLRANSDRLDIFWAPTHRMPRLLSTRIARVMTVHDLVWARAGETMRPMSRLLDSRLMPEAVRLSDRVIAVSDHTAKDLAELIPISIGKTVRIHLGPPAADRESPSAGGPGPGPTEPYILFVGTLEPRKNLARLIAAYAQLPAETRTKAKLAIVGGRGWGGVDVTALAERHGVSGDVKLLGYVSDAELGRLYSEALFLAMPSLYEGFGLPLLEAMSRGTPVLTSNRSSIPEVVGDAALLIDPEDTGAISKGLATLLEDKSLTADLGRKARLRSGAFSWDRSVNEAFKIFDQAVEARRSSR